MGPRQSGDRGLGLLTGGRLTITGRDKEVVIVNGVNFSCGEIEDIVERIDSVLVSYTAACPIRQEGNGTDELVIFFCSGTHRQAIIAEQILAIRQTVTRTLGVNPRWIVPVSPREIPKSSIGKIQRTKLLRQLDSGVFDQTLEKFPSSSRRMPEAPATEVEPGIINIWAQAFDTDPPGPEENFFDLGGHSLVAVQIIMKLQESFGMEMSISDLFDAPTVRLLAEKISSDSVQATSAYFPASTPSL